MGIMPIISTSLPSAHRGFSLIEAAIVLGVVGLIIGGIWVAASTVQENLRVKRTVEGVLHIASRGQESIPISIGVTAWTDITSSALNMGMIPNDWINGNNINNPFGYPVRIAVGTGNSGFYIYIQGITESRCRRLLGHLAGPHHIPIVLSVWNDDKAIGATTPITHEHSICSPPISVLAFYIRRIRIN